MPFISSIFSLSRVDRGSSDSSTSDHEQVGERYQRPVGDVAQVGVAHVQDVVTAVVVRQSRL